ncbi:DUF1661 domain-containing protein [Porphyromonas gingivalis]|nr:DUF1661 domain-containing protein [Porphyromonas gingivalis]RZQ68724.1 DUF1661 domain-containing protein [Porphyromonas gingivalis]HBW77934.1 hypothetical protein [Porphyromonas gingivalis]
MILRTCFLKKTRDFFPVLVRKFFASRTKIKFFSRHVFQCVKQRFSRA